MYYIQYTSTTLGGVQETEELAPPQEVFFLQLFQSCRLLMMINKNITGSHKKGYFKKITGFIGLLSF